MPVRRDRGRAVVLGLLFVTYIGLLVVGEATVDAGTAEHAGRDEPADDGGARGVVLGERAGGWLISGLLVGFAGAALIALGEGGGVGLEGGRSRDPRGGTRAGRC